MKKRPLQPFHRLMIRKSVDDDKRRGKKSVQTAWGREGTARLRTRLEWSISGQVHKDPFVVIHHTKTEKFSLKEAKRK